MRQETQPSCLDDKGDPSLYENKGQIVKKAPNLNLPEDWSRFTHAKGQPKNLLRKTKRSFFEKKTTRTKET